MGGGLVKSFGGNSKRISWQDSPDNPPLTRRIVTAKIYEDTRDRLLAIKDRLGLASLAVAVDRVVKKADGKEMVK